MQKLIQKGLTQVKTKVDEEFPHRIIAKELEDLSEIVESSYGLIQEWLKGSIGQEKSDLGRSEKSERVERLKTPATHSKLSEKFEEEPQIKLPKVRGPRAVS